MNCHRTGGGFAGWLDVEDMVGYHTLGTTIQVGNDESG
jgi:hypothetical protein